MSDDNKIPADVEVSEDLHPEELYKTAGKQTDDPVPEGIELSEDLRPETMYRGPPLMSRREFVGNTMKLAVAGALIPAGVAQVLPAIAPGAGAGGGAQPVIRRDPNTNAKIPITIDDLAGEPPVVVTAEWNFLPAVVYKVKKSVLQASTKAREYNTGQHAFQHPTEPEHAIMVYEGKCKHLGCTVGWDGTLGGSADIEDYDGDGKNDGRILCPCHQGQYDIYDLAKNVPGTPPPTPLNVVRGFVGAADVGLGPVANSIVGFAKIVQEGPRAADVAGSVDFALYEGDGSD